MISLTQQERDKFAAWLEWEAQSNNEMAEQAAKLPGGEILAKHIRQKATLVSLVAMELRKIEDISF